MKSWWPILLLLSPALMGVDFRRAEKSLHVGRYLMASRLFRQAMKESEHPNFAELGLARSQVAMGRCAQGLERLARLRKTEAWSYLGASVEGLCHLRMGHHSEAVAAFEESLRLNDEHPVSWFGLVQAQRALGEEGLAAQSAEALAALPNAAVLAIVAGAERPSFQPQMTLRLAVQALHDIDRLSAARHAALLEGRAWLKQGHPQQTIFILRPVWQKKQANVQLSSMLAEAYRRVGEPTTGEQVLDHVLLNLSHHPTILAVRIRLATDQGSLHAAGEWIELLKEVDTDEARATRWYADGAKKHRQAEPDWSLWVPWERVK